MQYGYKALCCGVSNSPSCLGRLSAVAVTSVRSALTERRIWQWVAAHTLVGASGWLLACPQKPDEGRRERSLVKSAAASDLLTVPARPHRQRSSRQPTAVEAQPG